MAEVCPYHAVGRKDVSMVIGETMAVTSFLNGISIQLRTVYLCSGQMNQI